MPRDDLKEDLKQRCDIEDVIGRYVPSLQSAGSNFKGLCPFHQEKTPSFLVYPESQHYYCYGCHRGGDVFTFIMELEGVDFPEAMRLLGQMVGLDVDAIRAQRDGGGPARDPDAPSKTDLYELQEKLAAWYQEQLQTDSAGVAREYCRDRGLSDEIIERFRIGYAPDSFDAVKAWGKQHAYSFETMLAAGVLTKRNDDDPPTRAYDRWRHRLMFPIRNPQGRVIAFSGRVLDEDQKGGKYVNSPETRVFHKGATLYGLAVARRSMREHDVCLLCEGQMDAIACHAAGFDYAVAPQGTAFTSEQARLIKRYTANLVLCFDGDSAGVAAALKSAPAFLPAGLNTRVVRLDADEDPDSLIQAHGAQALQQRIDAAEDFFSFVLAQELEQNDDTPAGRTAAVQHVLEHVALLDSPIIRNEYCQMLAERLGLRLDAVFGELNRVLNRNRRKAAFRATDEPAGDADDTAVAAQPEDPVTAAEGMLLDLCLHHEEAAHRLSHELDPELVSNTPTGRALNDLLAHCAQGEWEASRELLLENVGDYASPLVTKALNNPELDADLAPDKVEACYRDCCNCLHYHAVGRKIAALEQQARNTDDRDARREIYKQLFDLDRERKQYEKGGTPRTAVDDAPG